MKFLILNFVLLLIVAVSLVAIWKLSGREDLQLTAADYRAAYLSLLQERQP
jgi:hypothetical protein